MVSVQDIRVSTGADNDLITDDKIQELINLVTIKTESYFQIKTTPVTDIERITMYDRNILSVSKTPLLNILKIVVDNTQINLDEIEFRKTGMIRKIRGTFLQYRRFNSDTLMKIQYQYGWVEKDTNTQFILSDEAINGGNDVVIELNNVDNLQVDNNILIQDYTLREYTKIKSIDTNNNTITVDLVNSYDKDIKIVKIITPKILTEFIRYETSVAVARHIVGSTYKFNTGFSKDGASFQKGVPYTHWERVEKSSIKLRDDVAQIIRESLMVVV